MIVELYIHGQLFRQWEFDLADYREPFCQVGFDEKEQLWARIIEQCKAEVESVTWINPYEFYVIVPAMIQPADVDPEDQEKFLQQIIENQNSSL
jgi:hypothetical protein